MSFTTIQNTTSWQSLQIAKEIRVAYNKRRTACGLSTYADPDNSVKVKDFIYAMQSGIEEMVRLFGDPTVTDFDGLTALPANFATVTAGMTYAGLTATGFWRRIPMDSHAPVYSIYDTYPTSYESGWSYGKIQSCDQAGPWLFCDLEKVLKALSRIVGYTSSEGTGYTAQFTKSNGTDGTGMNWTFPDDTVTGNVNKTAVDAVNGYVISKVEAGKANYTFEPLINSAWANYNLAKFRLYAGTAISGTTRAVKFVALPVGTDPLTRITSIAATGETISSTESIGAQTYFNRWFPKSPAGLGTLAWQTILGQIVDDDVPENDSIYKWMELDYNAVRAVSDYAFVDGATS